MHVVKDNFKHASVSVWEVWLAERDTLPRWVQAAADMLFFLREGLMAGVFLSLG